MAFTFRRFVIADTPPKLYRIITATHNSIAWFAIFAWKSVPSCLSLPKPPHHDGPEQLPTLSIPSSMRGVTEIFLDYRTIFFFNSLRSPPKGKTRIAVAVVRLENVTRRHGSRAVVNGISLREADGHVSRSLLQRA